MSALGHERRFRYLRGTSAYPPRLAVKADIPDRQVRARTGHLPSHSRRHARSLSGTWRPIILGS